MDDCIRSIAPSIRQNGDLAATNRYNENTKHGEVFIYKHARGRPKVHSEPDIEDVFYLGYDNHQNIFVAGENGGPSIFFFAFAELPKGSGTFMNVNVTRSIGFAGHVQWVHRPSTAIPPAEARPSS